MFDMEIGLSMQANMNAPFCTFARKVSHAASDERKNNMSSTSPTMPVP